MKWLVSLRGVEYFCNWFLVFWKRYFLTGIKISTVFQGSVQKLEVSYAACLSTKDTKFPNRSNVCFIIQIDCSNCIAYNDKSTIITGSNGYKSLAKKFEKDNNHSYWQGWIIHKLLHISDLLYPWCVLGLSMRVVISEISGCDLKLVLELL